MPVEHLNHEYNGNNTIPFLTISPPECRENAYDSVDWQYIAY